MELGAFTVAPWCISETDHAETTSLPRPAAGVSPALELLHTQLMARHMAAASCRADERSQSEVDRDPRRRRAGRDVAQSAAGPGPRVRPRPFEGRALDQAARRPGGRGLAVKVAGWLPRETTTLLRLDGEAGLLLYTYGGSTTSRTSHPRSCAVPNAALPKASTPAPGGAVPADSPQPRCRRSCRRATPARLSAIVATDGAAEDPGRLQCENKVRAAWNSSSRWPAPRARPVPGRNTNLDYLEFRASSANRGPGGLRNWRLRREACRSGS